MISRYLRNVSIRHKVVLLAMTVCCAALSLATCLNLIAESHAERAELVEEIGTLADVIAINSRAALLFDDRAAAADILKALHAQPGVVAAYLLGADEQVLARYFREGTEDDGRLSLAELCPDCDTARSKGFHHIREHCLCLLRPVTLDDERVGSVFLRVDLAPLQTQVAVYAATSFMVLLASAAAALLLATFLQRLISRPLEGLARAMGSVSADGDHTSRLEPGGTDEVGRLITVFNDMLERVEGHERELAQANRSLEGRVRKRTRELEEANRGLQLEVAERQRAEASLRMLEKGLETTQLGVTITDSDGTIIYTNPAEARMHGYSIDELLGQPAHILGTDKAHVPVALSEIRTWQRESENRRRDGSVFPVQLTSDLVTDPQGRPIAVVTVCKDITARREAERALRESEAKFKTICAAAQDAIVMTDDGDCVTVWNEAAEQIFGYPTTEILGRPLHPLLAMSGQQGAAAEGLGRFQKSGRGTVVGRTVELTARRKDGTLIPVELSLSAVEIDGRWNAIGVARDITEHKEALARLQASLQEKEVLLKEVHHRVKNNLQVISSLLNLQLKQVGEEAGRAELTAARSRIRSMAMIHESFYQAADLAHVDFGRYVQEVGRQLFSLHSIDPQRIRLRVEIGDVRLDVDSAIACGMIVNELLTNALKHAFPAGSGGEVVVSLACHGGHYHLRVSDDGVGMDDAGNNGSALGLQIVAGLAGQLRGEVITEKTGGARISVRFPKEKH